MLLRAPHRLLASYGTLLAYAGPWLMAYDMTQIISKVYTSSLFECEMLTRFLR